MFDFSSCNDQHLITFTEVYFGYTGNLSRRMSRHGVSAAYCNVSMIGHKLDLLRLYTGSPEECAEVEVLLIREVFFDSLRAKHFLQREHFDPMITNLFSNAHDAEAHLHSSRQMTLRR
jgi:hypothetical protein